MKILYEKGDIVEDKDGRILEIVVSNPISNGQTINIHYEAITINHRYNSLDQNLPNDKKEFINAIRYLDNQFYTPSIKLISNVNYLRIADMKKKLIEVYEKETQDQYYHLRNITLEAIKNMKDIEIVEFYWTKINP